MSIKSNLQAAAINLFNTFESMIINATYKKEESTYAPGGNNVITTTEYSVRLIRDTRRLELTLSMDIPRDAVKYMLITSELAVPVEAKDRITVGGETKSIVAVETDPGDIVTVFYAGDKTSRI